MNKRYSYITPPPGSEGFEFKLIGKDVKIFTPISIIRPQNISIGSHVIIGDYSVINGGDEMIIGNHVHLSANISIIGGGYTHIEDFVNIGYGSRLIVGTDLAGGRGLCNPTVPEKYRATMRGYITMRKHSILGANVVVHPDVEIGEGAVVGSLSVVTKNLEPWGIYMGRPVIRVKDRPKETILRMERELIEDENRTP